MINLALFKSHFPLGDLQPNANSGETEDQTGEPTSQTNPDNGENRKPLVLERRQRVAIQILVPFKRRRIELGQVPAPVGERSRDRTGEAVARDVEGGEAEEEPQLLRNLASEEIVVEIDDVEVGAHGELRRDVAGEAVGGEVEDGEVDKVLEVGGNGSGEGVGGEVKGLEVGAVGEERGDGAAEREVRERKLVDSAIVAGRSLEVGGEAVAGVGEGRFGPVLE